MVPGRWGWSGIGGTGAAPRAARPTLEILAAGIREEHVRRGRLHGGRGAVRCEKALYAHINDRRLMRGGGDVWAACRTG